MFALLNKLAVKSCTLVDWYDLFCKLVSGATEVHKKCNLGNGIMFTANFLKSEFNCDGNLNEVETPAMALEMRELRLS